MYDDEYDDEAQATEAYTHSHAQTMPSQICVAGGGVRGPRRALLGALVTGRSEMGAIINDS